MPLSFLKYQDYVKGGQYGHGKTQTKETTFNPFAGLKSLMNKIEHRTSDQHAYFPCEYILSVCPAIIIIKTFSGHNSL
jgi:hypothetical protein